MAFPAGTLADTLGSRRTLTAGASLMAFGSAAFGLAPSFAWAFAGRVLVGLGSSVILISWLRLGSTWCRPDEAARLAGLSQAVGAAGGLVGTTPLAMLVGALGRRASFVVIGAATAFAGAACWIAVRDRPPLGRDPVGREASTAARAQRPAVPGSVGLGAISVGWVSDRLVRGRRLPMIVYAIAYAGAWCGLALPAAPVPLPWLGPLCLLLGLASSGVVIPFAAVPEVNDPARPGIAIGFCNIPIFAMVGLLQWLAGAMLDLAWDGRLTAGARLYSFEAYRSVFLLCAVLAAASAVIAWAITETRCRNVWVPRTVARMD